MVINIDIIIKRNAVIVIISKKILKRKQALNKLSTYMYIIKIRCL